MLDGIGEGPVIASVALALGLVAIGFRVRRAKRIELGEGSASAQSPQRPLGVDRRDLLSYEDVQAACEARGLWVQAWHERIAEALSALDSLDYETAEAKRIVDAGSDGERGNLATILEQDRSASADRVVGEICRLGSHSFASLLGRKPVAYREVVADVARKMGVPKAKVAGSTMDLEQLVIGVGFDKVLERLSPEQREALLQGVGGGSYKGVGGAAGTLTVAHLGGFSVYLMASTVLSAVTGSIGLTLPFAVYTGMSVALSVVLGPIGWIALGLWAFAKMGGPNYKKTIPAVLAIACMRARLIAERDQQRSQLHAERDGPLAVAQRRLDEFRRFLSRLSPASHIEASTLPPA